MAEPDPKETQPEPNDNKGQDSAHGYEHSAERDSESHQAIGEHDREVERKIGETMMPDRK